MSAVSSLVQVNVTIKGLPPGLMFQGKGLMDAPSGKQGVHLPPEEEAKLRAHWMKVGNKQVMCIPWVMLYRSICAAGQNFKWRGRKTFAHILPSTISGTQDRFSLGTDKFETNDEYVRIPPKTGPCVRIGRPVLKDWQCSFSINADCEMWNAADLEQVIVDAGKLVGIGANRPSLKGPYGKFSVEKFDVK